MNRPFSHCFGACVNRSRDALFLDNRRDFTKMGQTDFKPMILSMKSVIINRFNNLFNVSSRRNDALCTIFIFHNLIQQKNCILNHKLLRNHVQDTQKSKKLISRLV